MNIKHCSLLTASILLACNVNAAGFQVAEHSASGLGRAFSGEAAVADNASVLARNPAAMTLFDTAQFSGALSIVDPDVNVTDVTDPSKPQKSNDVAPMAFVPASYYISPINEQWAWGLALFTTYGVATDYPDDIDAGDMAGNTALTSVNLNPNIAYRVNDNLSFGAGVNLVYAIAELDRHKGALYPTFSGTAEDKLISMEGTTFSFGWNIGALYEVNDDNRFGVAYRSAVELDFDGTFTDHTGAIMSNGSSTDANLKVDLPDIFEISGFHKLNQSWAVHYSVQRTMWSKFEELRATSANCDKKDGICFLKEEHYEDSNRYSIGATHYLNDQWTLRAGYALDEKGGKATLSIPDSDRNWYSAGATYQYSENLSFDAGFALIASKSGSFKETNAGEQEYTFESEGNAYITALQVNYVFN